MTRGTHTHTSARNPQAPRSGPLAKAEKVCALGHARPSDTPPVARLRSFAALVGRKSRRLRGCGVTRSCQCRCRSTVSTRQASTSSHRGREATTTHRTSSSTPSRWTRSARGPSCTGWQSRARGGRPGWGRSGGSRSRGGLPIRSGGVGLVSLARGAGRQGDRGTEEGPQETHPWRW